MIPAIPERADQALKLQSDLISLIGNRSIEVLVLFDNKQRSIGLKRDALVQISKGKYLSFIDDDDKPSEGYVDTIYKALLDGPDIVTFKSKATINGKDYIINFGLYNENEQLHDGEVKRGPFLPCVFKSEPARAERFKDVGYSEDWDWAKRVIKGFKKETHLNEVLHRYIYSDSSTAAPRSRNEINKNGTQINGKIQILK